ncbi:MAG: 50S ribosomal protein L23 [Patescibacteria group bacterium]|nr:50S ribosomal protein L23 [Patescibacteria group bacterium]
MNIKDVILKPILTEKATNLAKNQYYSFKVNIKANKNQIKKAIESLYNVKVYEIKTIIRKGKKIRIGRKRLSIKKTSNEKIAFIKLKEGKIDIFPQV